MNKLKDTVQEAVTSFENMAKRYLEICEDLRFRIDDEGFTECRKRYVLCGEASKMTTGTLKVCLDYFPDRGKDVETNKASRPGLGPGLKKAPKIKKDPSQTPRCQTAKSIILATKAPIPREPPPGSHLESELQNGRTGHSDIFTDPRRGAITVLHIGPRFRPRRTLRLAVQFRRAADNL